MYAFIFAATYDSKAVRAWASPCSNATSTLGSMPSRIFFTSASVAVKISWTFAVTWARFASSLDFVLPFAATSLAMAAPLAPCIPVTPAVVCATACCLFWAMVSFSSWRYSPGARSACSAAFCLSASAPWNSGSPDFASCWSVTSASAISWLASCLPASRLTCSAGTGFGAAPAAGIGTAFPGSSCWSGVTSLGTAFDWSGGASVAASMSLAEPSLPCETIPLTSPLTSPAFPDSL